MSALDELAHVLETHGISRDGREAAAYLRTRRCLGTGSYGSVYLSYRAAGDGRWIPVATKEMRFRATQSMSDVAERVSNVAREAALLASAAGHRVVSAHRPWFDGSRGIICLPLELCDESLDNYRCRHRATGIPPQILYSLFLQCLEALEHLQRAGVVHNDIKPNNILLVWPQGRDKGAPCVKLTDFGLSATSYEIVDQPEPLPVGTPFYMAPETLDLSGAGAPHARDVWSLGCSFYELLTGTLPFPGRSIDEVRQRASSGVPVPWTALALVSSAQLGLYHLLRRVFLVDPVQRPTPSELKQQVRRLIAHQHLPPPHLRYPPKSYVRYIVCRPGVCLVVYTRPTASAEFATAHAISSGDDNIIADPSFPSSPSPSPHVARSRTQGLLSTLFNRPADAGNRGGMGSDTGGCAARAKSVPTSITTSLSRRSGPVPPPAPLPTSAWVHIVFPYEGYCQRVLGGQHLLHAYESRHPRGCPPLCTGTSETDEPPTIVRAATASAFVLPPKLDIHECEPFEPSASAPGTMDSPPARPPALKPKRTSRLRSLFTRKTHLHG